MRRRIFGLVAAGLFALTTTVQAGEGSGLEDPLYLLISESGLSFPDFTEEEYEGGATMTIVTMGQFGPPIGLPTPGFTAATSFDLLPTGLATEGREILFLGGLSDESLSEHVFMGVAEGDDPGALDEFAQSDIVFGLEFLPFSEPGLGALGGVASGVSVSGFLDFIGGGIEGNEDIAPFIFDGSMTTLSAGMAEETIHAFTPAAGFTGMVTVNNQGGLQVIIAPVPEPTAVALLCAGALALVVRRRRRKA